HHNPPHLHSFPTRRSSDLYGKPQSKRTSRAKAQEPEESVPNGVNVVQSMQSKPSTTPESASRPANASSAATAVKTACTTTRRPRSEEHTSELQSLRHLVCR